MIDLVFHCGTLNDLPSADCLALLHELLDHGLGRYITSSEYTEPFRQIAVSDTLAVLQRLAASPATARRDHCRQLPPQAAYFTKGEVLKLADAAIAHGHDNLARRLLALPVLQSMEVQELCMLLETAAHQQSSTVFWEFTQIPRFEQVDVKQLLKLLKLLAQQPPAPANERNGFNRMIASLYHLPVQYGQLLKAAMRSGEARIFSALTEEQPCAVVSSSQALLDEDFEGLLKEAVADGHELAACNLLRLPKAGKLPRDMLQQLYNMSVEKGQVVVQRGLDYLLHLQQLEASISS
jgi:hypothetical protein